MLSTPRSLPLCTSVSILLTALTAPLAIPSAQAAVYLWDANPGTAAAQDGSGTWNTATNNWITGGTNVLWANANDATFGAGVDGTYAIDLAFNPSATSLVFNNSGYTLSALAPQTITVTNNGANIALTVAAGKTATIGNNVTVGTGTTNAAYTVSGAGRLIIDNGGTLKNNAPTTSNVLNLNNLVEVNTGGTIQTSDLGSGNGNAIFINGTVTVNGGTLNSFGTVGLGQSTAIATPAILTINDGLVNATSLNGIRFGAATNATPGGEVNLNGGILRMEKAFKGTNVISAVFNFNGGTLRADASVADFMGGLTRANVRDGGARIDTNGNNITITQVLEHSDIGGDSAIDGGLTKGGAGTLFLNAANTYNGPTTINGGTLRLGNSASLGTSTLITPNSGIQVQLGSNPVGTPLNITNTIRLVGGGPASDGVLKNLDGVNTLTDFGVSGGGGTRINVAAGTLNIPNTISIDSGVAQNLRVIGTGTIFLGGDNGGLLGFNENFLIGSGTALGPTVLAGNDSAFGFGTIDFQPGANSTLASNDATAHAFFNQLRFSDFAANHVTFGSVGTGDLNFSGVATMLGNTEITVQNSVTTLSGRIDGVAALTKSGPGTLVLSGGEGNTFDLGTTVSAGVLQVEKSGGLGLGDVTVASGTTLKLELDVIGGNDYIGDNGKLLLAAGSPSVQLNFTGVADTILSLSFDGGATFVNPGIWGSLTSGAQFTSPLLSGSGTFNVLAVPEPNTAALFVACTALLGLRRRRANS